MADITDNLTGDPLTITDPTTTGSTDPVAPIAISLDQADADYAPGETVGITTTNVSDGGTFTFEVAHLSAGADGILGTADDVLTYDLTGTGTPWTVTDGGAGDLDGVVNGSIQTSWYVNGDAANQAFVLTATDSSGNTATTTFTDAPKTPPTTFAYADTHIDITADNTIVNAAGAVFSSRDTTIFSNLVSGSSGTGNWSVFAQIQNAGAEQGFNSADGVLDEKTSSQHNMVIALNTLVKVDADGTVDPNGAYYAFRLDMHQTGANPFLSLDQLKIYQSANGSLGAGSFAAGPDTAGTDPNFHFTTGNTTLAYNMNAGGANSVLMDAEYDSGSGGGGDVIVLVPTANFNPANGNFLYFYTAMGFQGGDWSGTGTFEEWSALSQPALFSISGHKYTDVDGDDATAGHNGDDTPLAGITINLYASGAPNTVIASTVTAVDGSYSFNNLGVLPNNQNYIVKEVLPSGDTQTLGNNGYIISSTIGTNSTGNDFANFVNFSISGHKYTDVNGDDASAGHNNDDTPLAGITINLYASGAPNTVLQSTQTLADGSYSFTNLGPLSGGQTYVVKEVLPSGDIQTLGNNGYIVAATSGNNTTGEDFANFVKFSISGTKYTDANGDGSTLGDVGLGGITINLYASGDQVNPIAQTTTAANGSYHFDNLGPLSGGQTYVVKEVLPSGDIQTLGNNGYIVAATSGNNTTGEDFANFVKFSISGTKYTDANGDGSTTGDVGLGGITINLYASGDQVNPIAQTTTAANGSYHFDNLGPLSGGQTYVVKEVLPSGDIQTLGNNGYIVAATSGNNTTGEDFANFVKFSISGTKYTDANGDGSTLGDVGLGGITINLYASNDQVNPIAQTTTAANGSYHFDNLGPLSGGQTYVVKEVLPSGDIQTLGNNGYIVAATSGNNTTGEDFANFVKFSISGTKYTDANGDGSTLGDVGLGGITINLYASGDQVNPIAQTTTAANGSYHFDNLGPLSGGQTYVVKEVLPSGDIQTLGNNGYIVAATSGNNTTGEDFANFVKFSISGTKYTDANGDGSTTGDVGLGGITINLYASGDQVNPIAQTTTAGDGSYHFDNLGPLTGGQTYVVQEVLPNGDIETLGKDGYIVAATSGNNTTGENFANFETFSISGTKYLDANGDGQTTGDSGLAGITINLYASNDLVNPIAQTTTAGDGSYHFDNLGPLTGGQTYVVQEVLPNGDIETLGKDGYIVAATSGNNTTGENFANFETFSISGTKYLDTNGDGQTTGDSGLAGITINLYASNDLVNPIAQTTTAANGSYHFDNLGPLSGGQTYVVQEVLPNGDIETLGKDGYIVAATSGNNTTGENFANFETFSISGTKYLDANGDGQTTGDSGLAGITINLYASNDLVNPIAQTTTAGDGSYHFDNLGPLTGGQTYVVQEVLPNGDIETLGKDGYIVAATSGNNTTGENFANFETFSISGTKYLDANGDGQTTGDSGLAGITINLYASNDLVNPIAQTTTAGDGSYHFDNLGPLTGGQTYVVQEVLPNGDIETLGKDGYIVAATSGNNTTGENFANFETFSISGTKYLDANGDDTTTHNADDTPLGGITINLYASGDLSHVLASTVTAADGSYHFDNLGPLSGGQTYFVQEVLPNGYVETLGKDGYIVAATSGNNTTGEDFGNFLPPAGQGLTPGFWKNHIDILNQELGEYNSGSTSKTSFETIFGFQNLNIISGNPSIADALAAKGGGIHHLERSSAAAYLSAAVTAVPDGAGGKPELNFSFSAATSSNPAIISILNLIDANHDHTLQPGEVTAAVRDVLNDTGAPTSNFGVTGQPGIEDIANAFDAMNNQTHPDASVFLV